MANDNSNVTWTVPALRPAVLLAILTLGASGAAGDAVNRDVVTGDAVKGEAAFVRDCALCHTANRDGPNGFGPNLFGVVDRRAATAKNYQYSAAFRLLANWSWSPDGIASFIIAPAATVPGNRMSVFQGVSDKDLDDIIAYLAIQR
jgi:cytochrome c